MSAHELVRRLKGQTGEQDRHYAFWLGAGCSVSSGIPAAGSLVREKWLPSLHLIKGEDGDSVEEWACREFADYDSSRPAMLYGPLMDALFPLKDDKQRETERLCDGRVPGFGYAVVAALMSRADGIFSAALTTNFDDLIADSMYVFGAQRPLVIQHGALAGFVRAGRVQRPLVVKVHGDHRLSPVHTANETSELEQGIRHGVQGLLRDRGVIFVGYSGNDRGVIEALEELPPDALPQGVWWVSRSEPNSAIREWLEDRDATWVEAGSFDELMLLFHKEFEISHPTARKFEQMIEGYQRTYEELDARVEELPESAPDSGALKEASKRARETADDWWKVELEAAQYRESDPARAERIYDEGVKRLEDSRLLNNYAIFLTNIRKDHDGAEELYKRAIEADPENAIALGACAIFLKNIRKDHDGAEALYKRAIEADPENAINLGNYAIFLTEIRKDHDGAEELYKRAIEIDPENASTLGNYANLLTSIRKDHDGAEELYKRAIEADPENAINLGNYARLLTNIRKDHDGAEELYKRAIEADPENAINLGNYASLLTNIRKDHDGAEELYKRAIEADPENAIALGAYAIFLKNIRKDHDGAEELYKRAIEADPENAINLGNYAIFLTEIRKDHDGAEALYKRAIEADPENAINLGNYASLLTNIRKDHDGAEALYKRAIEADPENAINLGNYAIFLTEIRKDHDGAEALYKRAIEADPENAIALGAYAIFLKNIRKDHDGAEALYKRAIEADPENAINLGNYANLLTDIRKDHDGAEALYKRAIEADPENAINLGNYANLLTSIRKDHDGAEALYKRAIEADPENAINLGNYARLLLEQDRDAEAWLFVDRSLDCSPESQLLVELWFYVLALRGPDWQGKAISELVRLLRAGTRSPGWSFQGILDRARERGRSDLEWLELLSDVISDGEDAERLDSWPLWGAR